MFMEKRDKSSHDDIIPESPSLHTYWSQSSSTTFLTVIANVDPILEAQVETDEARTLSEMFDDIPPVAFPDILPSDFGLRRVG